MHQVLETKGNHVYEIHELVMSHIPRRHTDTTARQTRVELGT